MKFIVAALFFASLAFAQDIYGVYNNDLVYFGDVESGFWTLIGKPFDSSNSLITLIQAGDVDVDNYVFYGIVVDQSNGFTTELVGLSLFTGQIVSKTTLPFLLTRNYVNTPGIDWVQGTADVLVYGRTGTNDDGSFNFQIVRVSPASNSTTVVAKWTAFHEIQSVDSFDPAHNILWIQTDNFNTMWNLGWDIGTGKLAFNLTDTYSLQNLNYNSATSTIIGLGSPNNGASPLVALDSTTGSYSVLGNVDGEWTIAGPSNAALNSVETPQGLLYLYADNGDGVEFISIDVGTAALSKIPFNSTYSVYPTTIAYAAFDSADRQKIPYARKH